MAVLKNHHPGQKTLNLKRLKMESTIKGKQDVVTGYFTEVHDLVMAIRQLKRQGADILDVHTPFPVHGLDKELDLPQREGLSRIGFVAGVIGLAVGFGMQIAISVKFYPINFGGKPLMAIPSFMPVVVMLVFLLSAFAIALGFMAKSRLGAGAPSLVIDNATTDDRFLVVVKSGNNAQEWHTSLRELGAQDIQSNQVQTSL
jgi:hypothetical protein